MRLRASTSAVALAAVASVLSIASLARAQGPNAAAQALFEQGRAALASGDYDTACARFRASEQLDPASGTMANLAACEEHRGKLATAWAIYKEALDKLPAGDERATVIRERVKKLDGRLPQLLLVLGPGAPRGTTVREGDVTLGTGATYGAAMPFDPGDHHLTVEAPGHLPRNLDVKLTEGKTASVTVTPGEPAGPRPEKGADDPAPEKKGPDPDAPPSEGGPGPGPWIVGGVGIAGLVVGGVAGALLLQKQGVFNASVHPCSDAPASQCTTPSGDSARNAIHTLGPVTTAGLAVGGAALLAGGVWLGVVRSGKATVKVGGSTLPGGALWRMEGSW
jgi:hypothetical protein